MPRKKIKRSESLRRRADVILTDHDERRMMRSRFAKSATTRAGMYRAAIIAALDAEEAK